MRRRVGFGTALIVYQETAAVRRSVKIHPKGLRPAGSSGSGDPWHRRVRKAFRTGGGHPMLLAPRQLQRAGRTGDVPYYGGRLTPWHVNSIAHPAQQPAPPATPPPPDASPGTADGQLGSAATAVGQRGHRPAGVRLAARPGAGMSAPVQVVVIGLHEPTFSGEVLTEIGRLQEAGIVRLVDVLLVTHAADGSHDWDAARGGVAVRERPAVPRRAASATNRAGLTSKRPQPKPTTGCGSYGSSSDTISSGVSRTSTAAMASSR